MKKAQRKPKYKPSFSSEETETLHSIVVKCFEKAYDYGSDFGIETDQYMLLARLLRETEEVKNAKYIETSDVGVVV